MTTDELTTQFMTIRGELKSFLLRMTASVQDAEDIVQEAYLKAHAKVDTFRGDTEDLGLQYRLEPCQGFVEIAEYEMYVDEKDGREIIVCTVGSTVLHYDYRALHRASHLSDIEKLLRK